MKALFNSYYAFNKAITPDTVPGFNNGTIKGYRLNYNHVNIFIAGNSKQEAYGHYKAYTTSYDNYILHTELRFNVVKK